MNCPQCHQEMIEDNVETEAHPILEIGRLFPVKVAVMVRKFYACLPCLMRVTKTFTRNYLNEKGGEE